MAIDQGEVAELFSEVKQDKSRLKKDRFKAYERYKARVIAWKPSPEEYERIVRRVAELLGI